jgi:tetratricopeptide (TPR) repeat protein
MGSNFENWLGKLFKRPSQPKPKYVPGDNAQDWNNYGTGFSAKKDYKEAIRCYDKALEFDPGDFCAWHNKGMALNHLRRYEEAIRCFDQALEIQPGDWNTWEQKGLSYAGLGRHAEADLCRKKALHREVLSHQND